MKSADRALSDERSKKLSEIQTSLRYFCLAKYQCEEKATEAFLGPKQRDEVSFASQSSKC